MTRKLLMSKFLGEPTRLAVFISFLLCALLWQSGFPRPMIDDLFFVGAGVNMANGGDLENPWIERQSFSTREYFVHPPLHSFLIAGWCRLFSVHSEALLAFQNCLYFVFCLSLIIVLQQFGCPPLFYHLSPVIMIASFLDLGLRPEAAAAALMFLGLAALLSSRRSEIGTVIGFGVIFLGGSISGRSALFSLALAASPFLRGFGCSGWFSRRKLFYLLITSAFIAILINLYLISFDLPGFLRLFLFHAKHRTAVFNFSSWATIRLGFAQVPFVFFSFLFFAVSAFSLSNFRFYQFRCSCLLITCFVIYGITGALGHGLFCFVFLLFAMLCSIPRIIHHHKLLLFFSFVAIGLSPARSIFPVFAVSAGKTEVPKVNSDAWNQISLRLPKHLTLLVDSWTMRYLFNYTPPNPVHDWSFSSPFPGTIATETPSQPNDCWVIGPVSMRIVNKLFPSSKRPEEWSPLGSARYALPKNLSEVFVVFPSELDHL